MTGIIEPLILDLVEWIGMRPRPYADVMDAWRTSCPRLTIWEDAVDAGFVAHEYCEGKERHVLITPLGRRLLRDHGCTPATDTRRAA